MLSSRCQIEFLFLRVCHRYWKVASYVLGWCDRRLMKFPKFGVGHEIKHCLQDRVKEAPHAQFVGSTYEIAPARARNGPKDQPVYRWANAAAVEQGGFQRRIAVILGDEGRNID